MANQLDLLIKNAQVLVTNKNEQIQSVKTNVGVKDGVIAYLGDSLPEAESLLDASTLHLLPGVIDSQVHFRDPGLTHKETLESGTRAALMGGVTSVFEMPNTQPPTTTAQALEEKIAIYQQKPWCNIAFYVGAADSNIEELKTLEQMPGVSGVKIFMGSSTGQLLVKDDETLLKVLKSGKRRVAIHAEDEFILTERKHLAEKGAHARFHPVWRNEESALNATKRILQLAKEARRPVHVLHVSTAAEMEFLAANKNWATVEVLPQHLFFSAPDCYEKLGNFIQQNPPIREKRHQEALWEALKKGVVDIIGSDHAPHTREEKQKPYPESPSGVPGVQTLVPILLNFVNQGKLSLEHMVQLVTLKPAQIFAIKNKGRIQLGYDADFTLVDLKKEMLIENSWIQSKCGWTPYHGLKVKGWPVACYIRGHLAMREGELISSHGKLLEFTNS